jgi:GTP:adenosylcobinamide-phosphate guanylyltransferase
MTKSDLQVIVQAGGRGSRLRHHTWNKPKCLVSVRGKPLLYHLFDLYSDATFFIIGDYAFEQLKAYLEVNPPGVKFTLVQTNKKGTASGISDALKLIDQDAPLLLTWSDLIISEKPNWPKELKPVVCTTSSFTCRWSIGESGKLHESPSSISGIPGLFYFNSASMFPMPPESGEFVKWFAANVNEYVTYDVNHIEELGDFSTIEESNDRAGFCRFFNKVEVGEDKVFKSVIDPNYQQVHENEVSWYEQANHLGFRRIPKIYSTHPLVMERIKGIHAYEMSDLTERERRSVMADYLDSLIAFHDTSTIEPSNDDIRQVYITKTKNRVTSVAKMIPGFERDSITVNGKKCRNFFSKKYEHELEALLSFLRIEKFVPIHGDPTFSNTLVDDKLRVWFIDPRGYFSTPGIYGDAWYDFAKVYYSAVGGYDAFNRRKFKLHVDDETVEILMDDPLFARTAQVIFSEYFGSEMSRIRILHGLIWLSLSGYAKDDIDSIIGSFYLGLYWLETGLSGI